jgi:poly(beta-D-mannuronate) C5 epimerase
MTALLLGGLTLGNGAFAQVKQVSLNEPVHGATMAPAPGSTQELRHAEHYTVTSAPVESLQLDRPKLPDLSQYTSENALKKIQRKPVGHAGVQRMIGQDTLKEFTGGDERLREWVSRQREMPQAIFINGGYVTAKDLAKSLPKKYFEETAPGVYIARLPIVVGHDATFHIDGKDGVKEFRMSQERGAFLVNDGKLFINDTKLTSWNEAKKGPASFQTPNAFRPFVSAWGGTETYIVDSQVTSLGYNGSKSYGVSISQYSPGMREKMGRGHPTGWIIGSTFEDLWYGFYCYEADQFAVVRNTYKNNIVYGIDPHDRSERLIIAENEAYGTHKKHGIIVSREVNDSWIFGNKSHDNKLSGIVLDRNSVNNVIADNEVYGNHGDGITLYESGNNLLWGNHAFSNQNHGIRVRNSVDIKLYENVAASNGKLGIFGHIKDLTNTDRNVNLDPFDTQVSLLVVGGKLIGNSSGPIGVDSPLSLELYKVDMLAPTKASGVTLPGILGEHQDKILDMLVRREEAVLIDPVETQKELQE